MPTEYPVIVYVAEMPLERKYGVVDYFEQYDGKLTASNDRR